MASSAVTDEFDWSRTNKTQQSINVSSSRSDFKLSSTRKAVEITDLRKLLHMAEELQTINIDNAKQLYKNFMKDPGLKEQAEMEDEQLEMEKEFFTQIRSGNHKLLTEDDLKEMENKQRKLMEENCELKKNSQKEQKIIQRLKEEVYQLKANNESKSRQLRKVQEEKKGTISSPSSQNEQTLKDHNTAIPDLNDPNRPMRLAEKYSELFDNEWIDALEKLTTVYPYDEEAGVKKLLDILTKCYKKCKDVADNQMKSLEMTLMNPGAVQKAWEEGGRTLDVVEESTLKALKDCRKEASVFAVKNIYIEHAKYINDSLVSQIPDYVKKCIELCWLMCVQDPPIVLGSQANLGERLDTNMFKAYTNSGTIVSYNVWPPLLLNEGGPLLAKGIAQPMKGERKPKSVANLTRSTATVIDQKSRPYQDSSKAVHNERYNSNALGYDRHWLITKDSSPRSNKERIDHQSSELLGRCQHHAPSSTDVNSRYNETYFNDVEQNIKYYDQRQSAPPTHQTNYQQNVVRPKKGNLFKVGDKWYYEWNDNYYDYFTDRPITESST